MSDWLPTGQGVLTFQTISGALQGIEAINADYPKHRHAARQFAEQYFAADRVLSSVLELGMN